MPNLIYMVSFVCFYYLCRMPRWPTSTVYDRLRMLNHLFKPLMILCQHGIFYCCSQYSSTLFARSNSAHICSSLIAPIFIIEWLLGLVTYGYYIQREGGGHRKGFHGSIGKPNFKPETARITRRSHHRRWSNRHVFMRTDFKVSMLLNIWDKVCTDFYLLQGFWVLWSISICMYFRRQIPPNFINQV